MRPAADSRLSRRRAFWVLAAACLLLIALVPWSVARAVRLLHGPSVLLPGDGYSAVTVAPGGRTLYAATGAPEGIDGRTVTPVDIATGKAGKPIVVGSKPQDLAVTPDGRILCALLSSGRITLASLVTGRATASIHVTDGAATMAVSPDSSTLFIGTGSNEVVAVDIATGRRESLISLSGPGGEAVGPNAMSVTADGATLYVAENDDVVIPVNLRTGKPGTPITVGTSDVTFTSALAVTPDGKTLYAAVNGDYGGGSGPNSLVAISTAAGTVSKTIKYGTAGPIALAVTTDGRTLYVLNGNYGDFVTDESTVTPVSTADGRPGKAIRTGGLFSHAGAFGFAIAPDGRTAFVAQGDVVAIGLPRLGRRPDDQCGAGTARHSGGTAAAVTKIRNG